MDYKQVFKQVIAHNYDLGLNNQTQIKVKLTEVGYNRMAEYANEHAVKSAYIETRTGEHYKGNEDSEGYTSMAFGMFIGYFGNIPIGVNSPYYTGMKIVLLNSELIEKHG